MKKCDLEFLPKYAAPEVDLLRLSPGPRKDWP